MNRKCHIKTILLTTLLLSVLMAFCSACTQNNTNKNAMQRDHEVSGRETITIDTFSTFPAEIDGCACYFSNDPTEFKNGEFIYMNDFANTSFLKINGTLTKFTQTDFERNNTSTVRAKYKSGTYEMIIEVTDDKQSGYETVLKSGTIRLTDQQGKTITKHFYGECGC